MFNIKNKTKSLSKDKKIKERNSKSPFQKLHQNRNRKNNRSLNLKDISQKTNLNINKINIRDFINQAKKNSLKNRISFHQKESNSFSRVETDSNISKVNQTMNLGLNILHKSKEKKNLNISKIPLRKKPVNTNCSYSNKNVVTEENKRNSRDMLRQNLLNNFPKHTHTNTNISITFIKNNNNHSKNFEEPKLYNDTGRSNSKTNNTNNNITNNTNTNNNNNYDKSKNEDIEKLINLKDEFERIENKIKDSLNNNVTYNKNKRYNIIQNIFQETIEILPEENQNLFKSILNEIHDVICTYSKENRRLKEENELYKNKIFTLEKEKINNNKRIIEKEKEIDFLKQKILFNQEQILSQSTNSSIISSSIDNREKNSNENKNNNNQNIIIKEEEDKIDKLNKKNYKDLDALYFKDKIKMNSDYKFIAKSQNGEIIPPLNFNFEEIYEKEKKKNYEKLSFIEKVKLSMNLD